MAIDIQGAMHDLIMSILGGRDSAQPVVADTAAAVHAAGLGEVGASMTVADFQAQVAAVCEELEGQLSAEVQSALSAYAEGAGAPLTPPSGAVASTGGGGGGSAPPSMPAPAPPSAPLSTAVLQEQIQYVSYVTYEGDETIVNEIYEDYSTNIDNSVDVDLEVEGDFDGDFEVETTNVNATGDGAIAAGDDIDNAATDGAVVVDGDNFGGIATGDGAVATGEGSDITGAVNTGEFTGVQAGENANIENVVVGDGNTSVQADGSIDDSAFAFGEGDATSFGDADINDSAIGLGEGDVSNVSDIQDAAVSGVGDATNVSDNTLDEGSAIGLGEGDTQAAYADVDVDAENAVTNTAQNDSDIDTEEVEQFDEGGDHYDDDGEGLEL